MRPSLCLPVERKQVAPPNIKGFLSYARQAVDISPYQTYRRPNHPDPARRGTLVQVLVQIVISQRARLSSEIVAADALFAVYPSLEALAQASESHIADLIRPAGLHVAKARKISALCQRIVGEFGHDFEARLRELPDEEARNLLMSLPGVGAKTADCMLELGLGRLRLPIETNIRKVGIRLALIGNSAQDDLLRDQLVAALDSDVEVFIAAHSALMAVGQRLCRGPEVRRPDCLVCSYMEEAAWAA